MLAATAWQKSLASSHGVGLIGSTTCRPLPPEVLTKLLSFKRVEPLAHLARGGDHVLPAGAGAGIEIEHQPVGVLAVVDGGAAGVDFQHAGLHQRDQPVEIVDRDDLVAFLRDQMQVLGGDAGGGVLLEKALPGRALRAAQQRDRPADDMRPHPFPDLRVEFGEIALGDAGVLPIDAVGMR